MPKQLIDRLELLEVMKNVLAKLEHEDISESYRNGYKLAMMQVEIAYLAAHQAEEDV